MWREGHVHQKQPLVERLCGPFKRNQVDKLPSGDRDQGFCLKTTRSNLLQDADIGKNGTGGQVGSRLPLTQCRIKTAWAESAGPGGEERQREEEKRAKQPAQDLLCVQPGLFQAFEVNQEKPVSKNRGLNDHVKIDFF